MAGCSLKKQEEPRRQNKFLLLLGPGGPGQGHPRRVAVRRAKTFFYADCLVFVVCLIALA